MSWKWYHPSLNRSETEKVLKASRKDGTFLARNSESQPNTFVLSLLYRGRVYHYKTSRKNDEGAFFIKREKGITYFDTLPELIAHFNDEGGLVCPLRFPYVGNKGEEDESDNNADYVYPTHRNDAETQLHQELRQRINELETSLQAERQTHQETRQRTNELETSLAAERQTHQETRQRANELETYLAKERQTHQETRQRKNELETSLAKKRQTQRETRQRKNELETSLATERQTHQETRQRANELETTLAAIQQAFEEYRNSRETHDWVLARNEISLSRKVIGEGAWGKVMEGKFRGCRVAVKQIHEAILSPLNRRLFEREMSIASRCRHPCLLQFIGATNDDQSPLFVTELLDTSLRAVLQESALDPTEITAIALDIAKGLNYLHLSHPAPIIHRDISSANVLLWKQNNRWRGKVADYGTANFLQLSMTVCPGAAVYSAPESQTSKQTSKVDVYSFGALLCEMNIRELPDVEHRNDQIVMVTDHFFRGLIRRCLHQDPKERPSMAEILEELNRHQSQ